MRGRKTVTINMVAIVVRLLITVAIIPYMFVGIPYVDIHIQPNKMSRKAPIFMKKVVTLSVPVFIPVITVYKSRHLAPQHNPKPIKVLPIDKN